MFFVIFSLLESKKMKVFSKIWTKVQKMKKVPNFAIFKVELLDMLFKRMIELNC